MSPDPGTVTLFSGLEWERSAERPAARRGRALGLLAHAGTALAHGDAAFPLLTAALHGLLGSHRPGKKASPAAVWQLEK